MRRQCCAASPKSARLLEKRRSSASRCWRTPDGEVWRFRRWRSTRSSRRALRLLHATVESKSQLVLELGEGLPPVGTDRFQLRQVVTNLILNALDAMEGKRGTLTLRTSAVRLQAPENERYGVSAGSYVRVTVTDTGVGIQAEARERLFEPFFSTKGVGRGMGLAAASGNRARAPRLAGRRRDVDRGLELQHFAAGRATIRCNAAPAAPPH